MRCYKCGNEKSAILHSDGVEVLYSGPLHLNDHIAHLVSGFCRSCRHHLITLDGFPGYLVQDAKKKLEQSVAPLRYFKERMGTEDYDRVLHVAAIAYLQGRADGEAWALTSMLTKEGKA